jgi:general stress protein 26
MSFENFAPFKGRNRITPYTLWPEFCCTRLFLTRRFAVADDSKKRFEEIIKDIQFGMFTSIDADGNLRSRPMTLQSVKLNERLWFFGSSSSPLAEDLVKNSSVNVTFACPKDSSYVSVSGQATISYDRQKIEELWKPIMKAWYPDGLADPKLCLIRLDMESVEYWDSPSSKVVQLIGIAKAIIQKKEASSGELGQHVNVPIR